MGWKEKEGEVLGPGEVLVKSKTVETKETTRRNVSKKERANSKYLKRTQQYRRCSGTAG